jgi:hypothetical protein
MTLSPKALRKGQRGIPPGVLFIQYAPLGDQLYVFLVTNKSLKVLIAPAKPVDLWKKIKAVRRQIMLSNCFVWRMRGPQCAIRKLV